MAVVDIENQSLSIINKNEKAKRRLGIAIVIIIFLATVALISTFIYFHFKNKNKTIDCTNIRKIDRDEETPKPIQDKPKMVDKHPNVLKPKGVDKVVDEQIGKVIIPTPELKKEVSDPVVLPVKQLQKLSYQEAYDKLNELAIKNTVSVIKGSYVDTVFGQSEVSGMYIYEWKIKMISEYLSELESVDIDKEFDLMMEYEEHIKIYGMYYGSEERYKESYKIFKKNKKIVEEHNKNPDKLYTMKLNHFAAFAEDTKHISRYSINEPSGITKSSVPIRHLPDQEIHVDWRDKGVVTDIVHQRDCGACWAIAATDVFNSYMAIKEDRLVKYSYQQVLDCVSPKFNCEKGGNHSVALEYIRDHNMCLYSEYEYIYKKIHCSENMCRIPTKINEIVNIKNGEELEYLKNNGPFASSFKTNTKFVLYDEGLYDGNCEFGTGHSVVVVGHGYDKVKKLNYWIVKNSWGDFWGEQGFFRIVDQSMIEDGRIINKCKFLSKCYGLK